MWSISDDRPEDVLARLEETRPRREELYRHLHAHPELSHQEHDTAATVTTPDGAEVPVSHACGHDVHVTCLLEAADLMAGARDAWSGTLVALFQPAEELGDGARRMVEGGVAGVVGDVDVAMAQHVLPLPAGTVATRVGPVLSAAGRIEEDIPVNHSPAFAPVVQPTLDVGTRALVVAALAHLT